MSKAFTREGEGDDGEELPPVEAWPVGVKNYLTPPGYAALRRELEALRAQPPGEGRRRLQREQRLQALLGRLDAAEVVDPAAQPRDVVRFGAAVTVADASGAARCHRIVGVDEADPKRGLVSWRSPIARALIGRRVGDRTTLRTRAGDDELIITAIDYSGAG